ncbi:MAG: exodeoxyribonuclease VII large subunit, partial [Eubacteriales bacterium]|nr:exodeoxyribonuclease VII large subunit [Eubacteriales bacterium]
MSEHIFTVSEINQYIKNTLENDPLLSNFWLKGELSNYINHSSGHMYFTIKDDSGSIKCVMFRSRAGRVRFSPSNGQRVIVMGYISLY